MYIKDFESLVDPTILSMAVECHSSGNVMSLDLEDGKWIADVYEDNGDAEEGDIYEVSVKLSKKDKILSSRCKCHDGSVTPCKHEVAVYLELKKRGEDDKTSYINNRPKSLGDLLEALDKEALKDIILEIAEQNKDIRNNLTMRLSGYKDEMDLARDLILQTIQAVTKRGFVGSDDVKKAMRGADAVLDLAISQLAVGDGLTALRFCVIVADEMVSLLKRCDDSNDEVYEKIDNALETMENVTASHFFPEMFDLIFGHATSSTYDWWPNWRVQMLEMLLPMCDDKANREKLEQYIPQQLEILSKEKYSYDLVSRLRDLQHSLQLHHDGN